MRTAQSLVAWMAACYCLSCGGGPEKSDGPTPGAAAPPTGASHLSAEPGAVRLATDGSLATRIRGRAPGRNRQLAVEAMRSRVSKQAPVMHASNMNPLLPPSGSVARVPQKSQSRLTETFDIALQGRAFAKKTEGGGLDLSFDPNVVEVVKVNIDRSTWEFHTDPGEIDNQLGTVKGIMFASFAGRTGTFPIATVTFRSKSAGDSKLHVSESPINPFASGGQRINVTLD